MGSVNGRLRKAFEKIQKLHSKNDFAFAIVVGDLFASGEEDEDDLSALLDGSLTVSIPIYFTLGESKLPDRVVSRIESSDTNEVASNVIFLGRKATLATAYGITVVALGGKLVQSDLTVALGRFNPLFYEAEARELQNVQSTHILITNQWPENIVQLSSQQLPETLRSDDGVRVISDLCAGTKPRYHFASSPGPSWEREPFKHPQPYDSLEEEKVTRFRALASIDNSAKDWMAAFNLDPKVPPPAHNATSSPFTASAGSKRRREDDPNSINSFSRFGEPMSSYQNGHSHKRQKQGLEDCFMCVNRGDFQAHMLVSIGEETIITVPKGPLPTKTTFPDLSWSGHLLIIPTHHAGDDAVTGGRPAAAVRKEFEEMTRYRKALCKMFQSKFTGKLGAVCWDANRTGIRHLHWQFMAVPADLLKKGLVEAAFKMLAKNLDYPAFQSCNPEDQLEQPADYFRIWTWTPHQPSSDPIKAAEEINSDDGDEGTETSLWFPLRSDQKFNIWFGREVMARLLKLDARINWKDTQQTVGEEGQDALHLKEDFWPFDFAMNTDG